MEANQLERNPDLCYWRILLSEWRLWRRRRERLMVTIERSDDVIRLFIGNEQRLGVPLLV